MDQAVQLFEDTLSWLNENYSRFQFFLERDVVWTIQMRLISTIEERRLAYRVFNDYPILPGNRRSLSADLVILNARDSVQVAAEFKYEPSHERGGRDIWPTKLSPSVVFWGKDGVLKDIERARTYVAEGKAQTAYALFIDEGGLFRRRTPHPGSVWVAWRGGVWLLHAWVGVK